LPTKDATKTERIVVARAEEIAEVRKQHHKISEEIDSFIQSMKKILKELDIEIQNINDAKDRELVRMLVINTIHKMVDEVFL
jgi:hypothetical protein